MAVDYIPQAEPEVSIWMGTYKTNIATHGPTLGLTPGEVTDQQTLAGSIIDKINEVAEAKAALKSLIGAKDTFKKDGIKSIRETAKRMKSHSNYTNNIGKELGIFGESEDIDEENIKPEIKASATPDGVKITFSKKGLTGVKVYSRLKGTSTWQMLGIDLHSPYHDSRPVANGAETREYMVRGILGDEEVGVPSDIVSAVFEGAIA